jgi:hypothetical protein
MQKISKTLSFDTADADKTSTAMHEEGLINTIVLVLPDFTTAATCDQLDIIDEDSHTIYTNSTGWAENAVHLITGLAIPAWRGNTVKLTLNAGAGGDAEVATVKFYIESRR